MVRHWLLGLGGHGPVGEDGSSISYWEIAHLDSGIHAAGAEEGEGIDGYPFELDVSRVK